MFLPLGDLAKIAKKGDDLIEAGADARRLGGGGPGGGGPSGPKKGGGKIEGSKRLTPDELATLKESAHEGAEYVDELGRTYDALGTPAACPAIPTPSTNTLSRGTTTPACTAA